MASTTRSTRVSSTRRRSPGRLCRTKPRNAGIPLEESQERELDEGRANPAQAGTAVLRHAERALFRAVQEIDAEACTGTGRTRLRVQQPLRSCGPDPRSSSAPISFATANGSMVPHHFVVVSGVVNGRFVIADVGYHDVTTLDDWRGHQLGQQLRHAGTNHRSARCELAHDRRRRRHRLHLTDALGRRGRIRSSHGHRIRGDPGLGVLRRRAARHPVGTTRLCSRRVPRSFQGPGRAISRSPCVAMLQDPSPSSSPASMPMATIIRKSRSPTRSRPTPSRPTACPSMRRPEAADRHCSRRPSRKSWERRRLRPREPLSRPVLRSAPSRSNPAPSFPRAT